MPCLAVVVRARPLTTGNEKETVNARNWEQIAIYLDCHRQRAETCVLILVLVETLILGHGSGILSELFNASAFAGQPLDCFVQVGPSERKENDPI